MPNSPTRRLGDWPADRVALTLVETGEERTYGELEAVANRYARLFRSRGLGIGAGIAMCVENRLELLEICLGALRSGLYYTAASTYLTAEETHYIVDDCGAKLFIASARYAGKARDIAGRCGGDVALFSVGGDIENFEPIETAIAQMPAEPIADETTGQDLLYSSGTTGRPKGVKVPLSGRKVGEADPRGLAVYALYGVDESVVYLSPAPLYHAAPLRYTLGMLACGGRCVVMRHFDPEAALAAIERYRCTHSQWVPTMFVRMLKLPHELRARYDVSSMKVAIHAAAPCPVPVKEQMIEWWGPVIYEYYAGSENNGFCAISPQEWLAHKGSVGRALYGEPHVLDEDGNELPPGETGVIYFGGASDFEYLNDPEKTKKAYNELGWSTLGDVGYMDENGYLYLTDRKSYMIISGGVNVYPQETENLLITHPKIADVAVFGIPDEDLGEQVKAVVQPTQGVEAGPSLEAELIAWCRERLSHIKCPKSIDFMDQLPRHPTGKLLKRILKAPYWD
ncbi:MAG: acyl-CoA synthetase [Gammaproteobacteria bacterium]|nr:acyl-CoA synthetase [Gammaproteobacteria bacterium]MDH4254972.1 acyl-CoA synthetase [Gammaproteobacteria bacterium]MDH5310213.1 acyl-CoA synthetase [Gammaproteobacteria bacterium]